MSPKRAARNEKFQRIQSEIAGEMTSQIRSWRQRIGDPNAPDYWTGKRTSFEVKRYDAHHRDDVVSVGVPFCPWPRNECEVPLGPKFNTPQYERA